MKGKEKIPIFLADRQYQKAKYKESGQGIKSFKAFTDISYL
jgi:hypothetical protein